MTADELTENIATLERILNTGEKVCRFADGSYVEYRTTNEIERRLASMKNQLSALTDKPRHRAFTQRMRNPYE